MTDDRTTDRSPKTPSLALRAGLGVIAAGVAALFAYQALGELMTAGVAALFFGLGVFFTVGRSGDGVDGGGAGDGGGDGGGG